MWIILLLFYPVNSIPFPKERCTMTDCSWQFHPLQTGTCTVHNTSVCEYSMSNFTQSPGVELKHEEEAPFSISVTPYTAEVYSKPITFSLSAINITLVIHGRNINALAVKITKQNSTTQLCRIFDFQRLESNFTLPVNFFYDCLYDLLKFQMDVIALPMNNLLSYYVYTPPSQTSNPISSCYWKPVIMVFRGLLSDGIVIVKFSQAPQRFNISFYLVELIKNSSKQLSVMVPCDKEVGMLSAKFYSVDSGYYSTIVKPLSKEKPCDGTELGVFQVVNSKPGLDALSVISICIVVLFLCCIVVFYKITAKYMQLELPKKKALLVFSHDCQEHKEFATTLLDYFTQKCGLEVSSIYNKQGPFSSGQSAEKWREDRYDESGIIIFLISEGLLITLNNEEDENTQQVKVFHPWKTQLRDASNYIFRNILNDRRTKKICKVRFSYSSQLQIPKRLDRNTGKCFLLPQQMNKFLYFAHDFHSALPCVPPPSICGSLTSSKIDATLLLSIEAVQEKVNNNLHVEYEPRRILNNNMEELNPHVSSMIGNEMSQASSSIQFCNISLGESLNCSETSEETSNNEDDPLLDHHNFIIDFDNSISDSNEHISDTNGDISDSNDDISESNYHISGTNKHISNNNEHISDSSEEISDTDENVRQFRLKYKNKVSEFYSEH